MVLSNVLEALSMGGRACNALDWGLVALFSVRRQTEGRLPVTYLSNTESFVDVSMSSSLQEK